MADRIVGSVMQMIPPSIASNEDFFKLEIKGGYLIANETWKSKCNRDVGRLLNDDIKKCTTYSLSENSFEKMGIKIKTRIQKFSVNYRSKKSSTHHSKLQKHTYTLYIDPNDVIETPDQCISMLSNEITVMETELIRTRRVAGEKIDEFIRTRKNPDPKPFHCATDRTKLRHLERIR